MDSDEARAATGDAEAYGRLVERHGEAARRVARGVLEDPEDADDAAQDGVLKAWRQIHRYRSDRPFGPWLMTIVINAARDLRRKRALRLARPLEASVPGDDPGPDRETERALLREALEAGLRALPERQRLAVVLHDAEGYSHRDIAASLGCPEGTARSLVFHGRRALRAALAPFAPGLEPPEG